MDIDYKLKLRQHKKVSYTESSTSPSSSSEICETSDDTDRTIHILTDSDQVIGYCLNPMKMIVLFSLVFCS